MKSTTSAHPCAPARAGRQNFQILLTRYALERLLYRLSVSNKRDDFILKGAMLFAVWRDDLFRPTRDLDLLGRGDPALTEIAASIRTICATAVPEDGVVFDVDAMQATPIRDETKYGGVRIKTNAVIAGACVPIQIDIGFGDVVTPGAIEIEYPVLIDQPSPVLRAYPPETVVAEKTEAIVSLGIGNSRMKDFYDLWMIAQTFEFDVASLAPAFQHTFARRKTPWPDATPVGLSDDFAGEKQTQWQAFVTRDRLCAAPASLIAVIGNLRTFLDPVLAKKPVQSWQRGGPWTVTGGDT